MGLWQCKLRYRTQEEVLEVARRYQKEGIKIDQIVIDFFHWTVQGDWKFDAKILAGSKSHGGRTAFHGNQSYRFRMA